jgi:Zn-dependent peptidase ImmA (M78 family)
MQKTNRKLTPEQEIIVSEFTREYPVKLGNLARALGISGIKVSSMSTGISGQINKDGGAYFIRVNRNEARERQRFTIAHEIAHFLLHRDLIDNSPDGITDNVLYRSGAPEQIEFEANKMAAEILMPRSLIESKIKNEFGGVLTETTIERLADSFEVSKAAMEIRLSNLR